MSDESRKEPKRESPSSPPLDPEAAAAEGNSRQPQSEPPEPATAGGQPGELAATAPAAEDPQQSTGSPSPRGVGQPPGGQQSGAAETAAGEAADQEPQKPRRRRILIGSQRDPTAFRRRAKRDWIPVAPPLKKPKPRPSRQQPEPEGATASETPQPAAARGESTPRSQSPGEAPAAPAEPAEPEMARPQVPEAATPQPEAPSGQKPVAAEVQASPEPSAKLTGASAEAAPTSDLPSNQPPTAAVAAGESPPVETAAPPPDGIATAEESSSSTAGASLETAVEQALEAVAELEIPELPEVSVDVGSGEKRFPPPNLRGQLPPDLETEFQEAMGDVPLDELIAATDTVTGKEPLEPDSKHTGRVVAVGREDVFVELGGREQGTIPVKQFSEPPAVGDELKVRVVRFNAEDGLYELALPQAASDVEDWSDLEEGMLVEARVTGHNSGGLECEVHHVRGFIPISQITLYRVENLEEFVGQKFTCLVTEANPQRRNLVLSRRAVLEREREEARKRLLESLEPGQVREGVVRKLMDFGAFVDLGGVDGLVHISQLGWGRVNHPREVLQEGQKIKVKVKQVDPVSGRISLAYRDLLPDPWFEVERKYPANTTVRGRVVKVVDFGAFVELEPGVEGLIHISELSHKKVWRVSDVVKEGDEVDVAVLSVDPQAKRISLSMKHLLEPEKEEKPAEEQSAPAGKRHKKWTKPLRGGLSGSSGGERFGLKW